MSTGTSTADLIDAALAAQEELDDATRNSAQAAVRLKAAQQAKAAADQALHDDLSQNGPAYTLDETTSPPVLTVYTAVDPDTWKATEIRPAA